MLYVKEKSGGYKLASDSEMMAVALQISKSQLQSGKSITTPESAKEAVAVQLCNLKQEVFGCLFLDSKNRLLEWTVMFFGTINYNTIHPREIVKAALRLNAASVIFAHNHPSGETQPSLADIELTKKLTDILKVIDIKVLDHLIIGDQITAFSELGIFTD
jgi:DNA repair protein RadC